MYKNLFHLSSQSEREFVNIKLFQESNMFKTSFCEHSDKMRCNHSTHNRVK